MKFWKQQFLRAEFFLSLSLALIFWAWSKYLGGEVLIQMLLWDRRVDIYGTFAGIFGALLGFIITSASIVLGYTENPKLKLVTGSKFYPQLWQVFTSNIRFLGLATGLFMLALVIDNDNNFVHPIFYINFWLFLLILIRLWRAFWVFENIIAIATKPKSNS